MADNWAALFQRLTSSTIHPTMKEMFAKIFMPTRPVTDITTTQIQNNLLTLQQKFNTGVMVAPTGSGEDTTTPTTPPVGTPSHVTDVTASESVYKDASGKLSSLVSVTYSQPLADSYFAGVQIWLTNYRGSSAAQLVAQGSQSPVSFTTEITNETVTVTVVSVGKNGSVAPFSTAPTTTVTLNGVASAPPAPSIFQGVVAINTNQGWQFQWNVENGLLNDVIAGYWVYSSTTNTRPTPPTGRVQYFQQPATNIGTLTFQELTNETKYYWVSAVNTTGLESTLTSGNTTTVVKSFYPAATAISSTNYNNSNNAFDGNETTAAWCYFETTGWDETWHSGTLTFMGFADAPPAGAVITGKTLRLMSEAEVKNQSSAGISYSLDAGATWTNIYDCSSGAPVPNEWEDYPPGDNNDSRGKQYDTITLPLDQDLTEVYVRANADAHTIRAWFVPYSSDLPIPRPGDPPRGYYVEYPARVIHSLYECRIDVAYQVVD